jgi:signal transduction histidine kinase
MDRRVRAETTTAPERLLADRFRLVSRVAGDLAHEIRNPLHSMVINLEVIRRYAQKSAMDGVLERANVLGLEIERLHLLIAQVLSLVRVDRDPEQEQDVAALLHEMLPLIEARARVARFRFHPLIEEDVAFLAHVQKQRVKLALLAALESVLLARGEVEHEFDLDLTIENLGGGVRVSLVVRGMVPTARDVADEDFDPLVVAHGLLEGTGAQLQTPVSPDGPATLLFQFELPRNGGA